jgi:hypothetical protein
MNYDLKKQLLTTLTGEVTWQHAGYRKDQTLQEGDYRFRYCL